MLAAIGLGCMSLSGGYGKSDDAAGIALIHHALDRGIELLDSADLYGWGHNEEVVGRAHQGTAPGRHPRRGPFAPVARHHGEGDV